MLKFVFVTSRPSFLPTCEGRIFPVSCVEEDIRDRCGPLTFWEVITLFWPKMEPALTPIRQKSSHALMKRQLVVRLEGAAGAATRE